MDKSFILRQYWRLRLLSFLRPARGDRWVTCSQSDRSSFWRPWSSVRGDRSSTRVPPNPRIWSPRSLESEDSSLTDVSPKLRLRSPSSSDSGDKSSTPLQSDKSRL